MGSRTMARRRAGDWRTARRRTSGEGISTSSSSKVEAVAIGMVWGCGDWKGIWLTYQLDVVRLLSIVHWCYLLSYPLGPVDAYVYFLVFFVATIRGSSSSSRATRNHPPPGALTGHNKQGRSARSITRRFKWCIRTPRPSKRFLGSISGSVKLVSSLSGIA